MCGALVVHSDDVNAWGALAVRTNGSFATSLPLTLLAQCNGNM